jgi:hypothetical protein
MPTGMLVLTAVKRRVPAVLAVLAILVVVGAFVCRRCEPPMDPARDPALDRAARCGAVFALFEHHLSPGVTGADAATVITDRSWISVDSPVEVLGGEVPVDFNFDDSVFVVHCHAAPHPDLDGRLWSDWVIYGRIAGKRVKTLSQFLATPSDAVLVEYALCYPDGRIERFGPR